MDLLKQIQLYERVYNLYKKNLLSWAYLNSFYDLKPPYCGTGILGKFYLPKSTKKIQIREKISTPYYKGKEINFNEMDIKKIPKDFVENLTFNNKFVVIEKTQDERIVNIRCNRWHCPECRKTKLRIMFFEAMNYGYNFNLNNHIIYTFQGKQERKKAGYVKSYNIMRIEDHKLNRLIDYDLSKVRKNNSVKLTYLQNPIILEEYAKEIDLQDLQHNYINFNRAQSNPQEENPAGFSHIHGLDNIPFNPRYLQERITKSKIKIGFTFARYKSAINYLTKDFWDKREVVIPYNKRLYSSTRGININFKYEPTVGMHIFKGSTQDEIENYILDEEKILYRVFNEYHIARSFNISEFDKYIIKFMEMNKNGK